MTDSSRNNSVFATDKKVEFLLQNSLFGTNKDQLTIFILSINLLWWGGPVLGNNLNQFYEIKIVFCTVDANMNSKSNPTKQTRNPPTILQRAQQSLISTNSVESNDARKLTANESGLSSIDMFLVFFS